MTLLLALLLAQDPDIDKLASPKEEERESAVDALIRSGERGRIEKALESATGDMKKRLETILHAIDVSVKAKVRLQKHLGADFKEIRSLYPETAARFFGDVRFFWVEDDRLKWPKGFVVDGGNVTQVKSGAQELIPVVEGRKLDAKVPGRSHRVLFLLAAAWFGKAHESNGVTVEKNRWSHSWGDFGIILTTDDAGNVTRAEIWTW